MSTIKQGIAEFCIQKHALEDRLRKLVGAEVDAFYELTGATIDGISVGIHTVERLGMPAKRFVSCVRVNAPLD